MCRRRQPQVRGSWDMGEGRDPGHGDSMVRKEEDTTFVGKGGSKIRVSPMPH